MSASIYYILHVVSGFLLTALTFGAFAAPTPETRKRTMAFTGIFSLVMLVGGFGLLARLGYSAAAPWVIIKIVCWLGLSALAGMAYRMPKKTGLLSVLAAVLVAIAVSTVYLADKTVG
ncbi:hypothetical protein Poly30_18720 [Planctomycetes bacterium Poly30]|uniref:Invasion gene expression up-regulator, SirB n=1 Tax=Saltatorellus ferox TaxID=2528018 RepID=A0A518EQJ9_9BACT|nr:hypothetical protein Poly30_18720 [Planctomycetes bacterium Poly30]